MTDIRITPFLIGERPEKSEEEQPVKQDVAATLEIASSYQEHTSSDVVK